MREATFGHEGLESKEISRILRLQWKPKVWRKCILNFLWLILKLEHEALHVRLIQRKKTLHVKEKLYSTYVFRIGAKEDHFGKA